MNGPSAMNNDRASSGVATAAGSDFERCDPPSLAGAALSRRVTLGGKETGYRHGVDPRGGDMYYTPRRDPMGGYPGDLDFDGPLQRESLDTTTAVLDAAILDLTRRRISMTGGSRDVASVASVAGFGGGPPYIQSAELAARQRELQMQQLELEQRQKSLEIQRQELLANHHDYSRQYDSMMTAQETAPYMSTAAVGIQQTWYVCTKCNTRAFSSHSEAMSHEATCVPVERGQSISSKYDANDYLPSFSMGEPMDSTTHSGASHSTHTLLPTTALSTGPFATVNPKPLAMCTDMEWVTPLHCFVRRFCVEIFCATQSDVAAPSKGKRKPIQVGQIGIRCPHCTQDASKGRERGSIYYPTSIASVYNATMNLLQRHLNNCPAVPQDIMRRYNTLKGDDARSGTSKKYWVESALSLGLVDTANGIRFSALRPPPLPSLSSHQHDTMNTSARRNSNDFFSNNSNAETNAPAHSPAEDRMHPATTKGTTEPEPTQQPNSALEKPLVSEEDEAHSTTFAFLLMSQMQPCVFTEADRLGKRKGLPPGFPGLACRHCFGGYGSGRFFPSSIKTLSDTSKTLNVLHSHMQKCRKCPQDVRDSLDKLRASHDDERSKMKFGSQKAFFARIWERLHGTKPVAKRRRDIPPPKKRPVPASVVTPPADMLEPSAKRAKI